MIPRLLVLIVLLLLTFIVCSILVGVRRIK